MPARNAPMIAARPICAANAARPKQRITTRKKRGLRELRRVEDVGPSRHDAGAAERDEGDERGRGGDNHRDRVRVDAALVCDPDGNGQQDHRQDVVDDSRAKNGSRRLRREGTHLEQHRRRDPNARRSRAAPINTLVSALSPATVPAP